MWPATGEEKHFEGKLAVGLDLFLHFDATTTAATTTILVSLD